MTARDLTWLAGLLEGEGSFYPNGRAPGSPVISLCMTDRDVVERAHRLLGGPAKIVTTNRRTVTGRTAYRFQVYGELAAQWMMTLYVEMGERRRAKIRELLAAWKAAVPHPRDRIVCVRGHAFTTAAHRMRPRFCAECAAAVNARVPQAKRRAYAAASYRNWKDRHPGLSRALEYKKRRVAIALLEAV